MLCLLSMNLNAQEPSEKVLLSSLVGGLAGPGQFDGS